MQRAASAVHTKSVPLPDRKVEEDVVVGKDVLELLTGAMYVEPLSVYREYVQNACDAIDEARSIDPLQSKTVGKIDIFIDVESRTIRIRDNGIGVAADEFIKRLTAIGASTKRGTSHRGFRGVGRLSGLGYCQELVFRSRGSNDELVHEITWDGRKLKEVLRDARYSSLQNAVRDVTDVKRLSGTGYPERFFEVELRKVIRIKNDVLLSDVEVKNYLAQVAPVPFEPKFRFGREIEALLTRNGIRFDYEVTINGADRPIFRPFKDEFPIGPTQVDVFSNLQELRLKDTDGNVGAVGWLLDHSYLGSIPRAALIGGLRVRAGNIQVGDRELLSSQFMETRFNGWSVGEFHILDRRVVPNGRRDDFEHNTHYQNIEGQIKAHARELTTTCRQRSIARNRHKSIEGMISTGREIITALRSRSNPRLFESVAAERLASIKANVERYVASMDKTKIHRENLDLEWIKNDLARFDKSIQKLSSGSVKPTRKSPKRSFYDDVIRTVYEIEPDIKQANRLVSRLVDRLRRKYHL